MNQAREYKLVFTGPMGAGKTTAIHAISEIPPVTTDVANTDLARHGKATTTTALDYGEVTLEGGSKLRLFGTPGQDRFDFMWEVLGRGALGVVILVDNATPDPIGELGVYLDAFLEQVQSGNVVVGVGRMVDGDGNGDGPTLADYHRLLGDAGIVVPVLSVDVRRREDVLMLLDVLFHQIEAHEEQTV